MDWMKTVGTIGIWLMLIIGIGDTVLSMIAYHYLKYSKNKILYEKLMLPVGISLIFLLILVLLITLPVFYTNEVPINIKIGLIILYSGTMGFGVWAVRHEYCKYKVLVKESSSSV